MTDQLLPRPQDCEMGKAMITKPFPAEHPYTSHMSRFAVFPKYDSPADPKRGSDARRQMPSNSEMPSTAYDITIVQKTKGFGYRHEKQALPSESLKKPLQWHDGEGYDQIIKTNANNHAEYYPIPPKMFAPNLANRSDSTCLTGNMEVWPRTATAARNVERDQWTTTYDRTHTGLGPANPNSLDNMHDKFEKNLRTGMDNDDLEPRGVRTFDPPRPFEGRIARAITSKPLPQTNYPNPDPDPNYVRPQTLTEREEHRLWNGKEYVNLPDSSGPNNQRREEQWKVMGDTAHHDTGLATLQAVQGALEPVPFVPAGDPREEEGEELEIHRLRREQYENNQQIEAQNRFKELELQKPAHNVTARKHKTDLVSVKTRPKVFYNHESEYQTERAGLYNTSYDPYKLQQQMKDADGENGPKLMDHTESHKDVLNLPKDLNMEMHELIQKNRTLGIPGSVPQLHDQPSQFEAMEPFNDIKQRQKTQLQPQLSTAGVRTQEKGIVLTESSYGAQFNTQKFMQENELDRHARQEPLMLMSNANNDLRNVRQMTAPRTARSVQFSDNITVASGANGEPLRMSSASLANPHRPIPLSARPETSPMFQSHKVLGSIPSHGGYLTTRETSATPDFLQYPVALGKSRHAPRSPYYGQADNFGSHPNNVTPTNMRHSWAGEALSTTQRPSAILDLSFKKDSRFNWTAGSGSPRPQSTLLDIQNSFTKSDARRRFHNQFPETNPDLRENILQGKKHVFGGLNAQILRGTPVVT